MSENQKKEAGRLQWKAHHKRWMDEQLVEMMTRNLSRPGATEFKKNMADEVAEKWKDELSEWKASKIREVCCFLGLEDTAALNGGQGALVYIKNKLAEWTRANTTKEGSAPSAAPSTTRSVLNAAGKRFSLFGDRSRPPMASNLWAAAHRDLVKKEVDTRCGDSKVWIGVRKQVVAELYSKLEEEEKKWWEAMAGEAHEHPNDPDRVYMNQQMLGDALGRLLSDVVGFESDQVGAVAFFVQFAYYDKEGKLEPGFLSIGNNPDTPCFRTFAGGPTAQEQARWWRWVEDHLERPQLRDDRLQYDADGRPRLPEWDAGRPVGDAVPILEAYFNTMWVYCHPPGAEPLPLDWVKLSTSEDMFPTRWKIYVKDPRTLRSHEIMMLYGLLFNAQDGPERFQFGVSWGNLEDKDKDDLCAPPGEVFRGPGGALNVYLNANPSSDEEDGNAREKQPVRTPTDWRPAPRTATPKTPAPNNQGAKKWRRPIFLVASGSESEDDGPVHPKHKSATAGRRTTDLFLSSPVKTSSQKRRATTAMPTTNRHIKAHPLGAMPALQPGSLSPSRDPLHTPSRHIISSTAASQASTYDSVPPKVSRLRFPPLNNTGLQAEVDDDLFGEKIVDSMPAQVAASDDDDLFGEKILADHASGAESEPTQAAASNGRKRKGGQGGKGRSKR
ncbi:hypothetical protein OBBRIDRAFT_807727 [Obba rivulosa]|uniref:Uncharacterized protein n=1 Tax=Obba rivulosa TaxID=1052685 RepID=A0A8E2DES1_9APHY|nr:hypothetical protein OBBRIDRAFT_807727 [Obba rivulosa]